MTSGTVRFQDDAGSDPAAEDDFADIVAAHPGEVIQDDICITQGFSGGDNAEALLRTFEVNGTTYRFRGN